MLQVSVNTQLVINFNQELFNNIPNSLGLLWEDIKALREEILPVRETDSYLHDKLLKLMFQVYLANPNPFYETLDEFIKNGTIKPEIIIHPKHWNEWVIESSISPIIALLNFQSLNTNSKDLTTDSDYYYKFLERKLTIAEKRLYDFLGYLPIDKNGNIQHESLSGWFFTCINPETGLTYDPFTTIKFKARGKDAIDDWGYCTHFKPNKPPLLKNEDKSVKYLCPKPDKTNKKISAVFFNTGNCNYWNDIIQNNNLSVLLTEGGKKAACGLSHNISSICLLGTYMGFSKGKLDDEVIYQLKPSLYPFIKDREVKITFDADAMTKESVFNAVKILYNLIDSCYTKVSIVEWFKHYTEHKDRVKGMDDLIAYLGIEIFRERLEQSITLPEYERLITNHQNQTLINLLLEYKNTADYLTQLDIKKQIIDLRDDLKYPSNFGEALSYYSSKLENNSNDSSLITEPLDFWEETKMIEWIVKNYFTRQSVSIIYGESGLGKSLLTYNLSKALIEATNFMDVAISKKHKVLYIQCDESPQETKQRMETIGLKEHFFNKDFMLIPQSKGWNFEHIKKLDDEISSMPLEDKPDFIIIDNLNHAKGAIIDINSSEVESMVIIPLKKLATKYNLHILILHHPRKNNNSFLGSSTIKNSLSYMGILKKSFNGLILEDDKCRNGPKRIVQFDFDESLHIIDSKQVTQSEISNDEDKLDPLTEFLSSFKEDFLKNKIELADNFTQKDVIDSLNLTKVQASRLFNKALDEGYFEAKERRGKSKVYGVTGKFKTGIG